MEELRRIRSERGWSQQKLADESGVNKATINQIERGKRSPNVETLERLAEALGVEVGELFPKAQSPLPFRNAVGSGDVSEAAAKTQVLVDTLADLHARLGGQISNLPSPPQNDTERVRAEAGLMPLINVFLELVDNLAKHHVTDEELRSWVTSIGNKLLGPASNWLRKHGEAAQVEDIDKKVENWQTTLQRESGISKP